MFAFDQYHGDSINLSGIYQGLNNLSQATASLNTMIISGANVNTFAYYNFNSPISSVNGINCLSGLNLLTAETISNTKLVERKIKEGLASNRYQAISLINLDGLDVKFNTFTANKFINVTATMFGTNRVTGCSVLNVSGYDIDKNTLGNLGYINAFGYEFKSNSLNPMTHISLNVVGMYANTFNNVQLMSIVGRSFNSNTLSNLKYKNSFNVDRVAANSMNNINGCFITCNSLEQNTINANKAIKVTAYDRISSNYIKCSALKLYEPTEVSKNSFNVGYLKCKTLDINNYLYNVGRIDCENINGDSMCFDFNNLHPLTTLYRFEHLEHGFDNTHIRYSGIIPTKFVDFDYKYLSTDHKTFIEGPQRLYHSWRNVELCNQWPNMQIVSADVIYPEYMTSSLLNSNTVVNFNATGYSIVYEKFNYDAMQLVSGTLTGGFYRNDILNYWYQGVTKKSHISQTDSINYRVLELPPVRVKYADIVDAIYGISFAGTSLTNVFRLNTFTLGTNVYNVTMTLDHTRGLWWYTSGTYTTSYNVTHVA